jgi:predicted transcriptional regulator
MKTPMTSEDHNKTLLELTAHIVSAHVAKNQIAAQALPALIEQVYNALKTAGSVPAPVVVEKQLPFVPAKRSIFPDYIVCLEDGRKLKTLKRHLRSTFGLSPEQYREKWGLAPDYPMVAPNYAQHRSKLAKQLGLGRKPTADEDEDEPETVAAAAPEPAAIVPEVPHVKRRAEPTAASVFAKFPAKQPEPTAVREEAGEPPARQKRSRKPFSKQLARTMRQ